jgi:hypothetical protein
MAELHRAMEELIKISPRPPGRSQAIDVRVTRIRVHAGRMGIFARRSARRSRPPAREIPAVDTTNASRLLVSLVLYRRK